VTNFPPLLAVWKHIWRFDPSPSCGSAQYSTSTLRCHAAVLKDDNTVDDNEANALGERRRLLVRRGVAQVRIIDHSDIREVAGAAGAPLVWMIRGTVCIPTGQRAGSCSVGL
jgi:hypothetical protein